MLLQWEVATYSFVGIERKDNKRASHRFEFLNDINHPQDHQS
jgi:hypothetical protein